MIEEQEFLFKPMGDPPTVAKLWKGTLIFLGIYAVICIGIVICANPDYKVYGIYAFIIMSLIVIATRFSTKYICDIRIDPIKGILYSSWLTHKGRNGITIIDIRQANYKYRLRVTKGYAGYILSIKDDNGNLCILETRSENNRALTNCFLRSQLDAMDQLIRQGKAN
jgi:hypothetical protein